MNSAHLTQKAVAGTLARCRIRMDFAQKFTRQFRVREIDDDPLGYTAQVCRGSRGRFAVRPCLRAGLYRQTEERQQEEGTSQAFFDNHIKRVYAKNPNSVERGQAAVVSLLP